MGELIPPQPLDVIQWVTVRLHQSGTISTSGTIGDKKMAQHLLRQGLEAVDGLPDYKTVVIPSSYVEVDPSFPVRDLGYMLERERGDP